MRTLPDSEVNYADWLLIDFNVERENWVYYELSDGARLRFKLVVRMIWRSTTQIDEKGDAVYSVDLEPLTGLASFPERLRRSPSTGKVTYRRVEKMAPEEALKFEKAKESLESCSAYVLPDGMVVTLRFNLTSVSRTKLRDRYGAPVYKTDWKVETKFTPNPVAR